MAKLPIIDVKHYVEDQSEQLDKARALVTHAEDLEMFYVALQPLFRELETVCGYKEGDDVNSWELVEKSVYWLRKAIPIVAEHDAQVLPTETKE